MILSRPRIMTGQDSLLSQQNIHIVFLINRKDYEPFIKSAKNTNYLTAKDAKNTEEKSNHEGHEEHEEFQTG